MSIKRMASVWEQSQHSGNALLLLLAVADYADECGVAWPGHERLAEKTRVSRRHIIRLVDETTQTGELWAMNRLKQQSNVYMVTPGLSLEDLIKGIRKAKDLGVVSTRGSDTLSLPPQVLVVVTGCPYSEAEKWGGRDAMSLGRDTDVHTLGTSMSLDPSLSVIIQEGNKIWETILSELGMQMEKGVFDKWLRGSELASADNGTWTVKVKSDVAAEWLTQRMMPTIARTVERHAPGVEVEFVA